MRFVIYDYVNAQGHNLIKDWADSLQKIERVKLDKKIDSLSQNGFSLPQTLLSNTDMPGIQKLRIHGSVQLRPLLCKGPLGDDHTAFTLLVGATERGGELRPLGVMDVAVQRKADILANPASRRVEHDY